MFKVPCLFFKYFLVAKLHWNAGSVCSCLRVLTYACNTCPQQKDHFPMLLMVHVSRWSLRVPRPSACPCRRPSLWFRCLLVVVVAVRCRRWWWCRRCCCRRVGLRLRRSSLRLFLAGLALLLSSWLLVSSLSFARVVVVCFGSSCFVAVVVSLSCLSAALTRLLGIGGAGPHCFRRSGVFSAL